MKLRRSKEGLEFYELEENESPVEGKICFSKSELDYLRNRNISSEEFKTVWMMKQEDHSYSSMPDKVKTVSDWIKEAKKGMGVG